MSKKFTFTSAQKAELLWWADQLETTYHLQGRDALCTAADDSLDPNNGSFCCLGLYLHKKNPKIWTRHTADRKFYTDNISKNTTNLPFEYEELVGFVGNNSDIEKDLIDFNDNDKATFPQIAEELRSLVATGKLTGKLGRKS